MSTSNVGYEFDQRSGKKTQKSLKSRKAHKLGATHRRGDEPRDRIVRYRLNGCRLRNKRRLAYEASFNPDNWLPAAPKPAPEPAPVKHVVVIHETASQRGVSEQRKPATNRKAASQPMSRGDRRRAGGRPAGR